MRPLPEFTSDIARLPFIHTGSQALPHDLRGSIMLLGNFDGLHLGHAALVRKAAEIARERGVALAMMQCDPHPRAYFSGVSRFRVSTGLAQVRLLADAGVDIIFAPRFDAAFAAMSADDFISRILVADLGVGGVVVGRDFRFGHRRLGDVGLLRQAGERLGFRLDVIDDQTDACRRISTSSVRAAISAGDVRLATQLMGHAWLTQVDRDETGAWRFASEQLLPPSGAWPIAALDRVGGHLCYALATIGDGEQVQLVLPSSAALVKWLPTNMSRLAIDERREGRAYA